MEARFRPPPGDAALVDLIEWARGVGLEKLLHRPVTELWQGWGLSLRAERAIAFLLGFNPRLTIIDLLRLGEEPVVRAHGVGAANDLQKALKDFLVAAAKHGAQATPRASETEAEPPGDATALRAWAEARGVAAVLSVRVTSVSQLVDERLLRQLGFGWSDAPQIADFVRDDYFTSGLAGFRARQVDRRALATAREACRAFVKQQAARMRAALAEEAAFLQNLKTPAAPMLARLAAKLLEARRRLRETVGPRVSAIALPTPRFEPSPPGIVAEQWIHDPLYAPRGRGAVAIDLRHWQDRPLRVRCQCQRPDEEACLHALTAVDATLVWIAGAAGEDPALAALSDALATPPWMHLLRAIDAGLAAAAPAPAQKDHLLSWRITRAPTDLMSGGLTLEPYLHKPLKRGGFSAGTRVDLLRIAAGEKWRPLPGDLGAAQALIAGRVGDAQGAVVQALAQLIGHPRVYRDRATDKPLQVREARLGFALEPAGAQGHLRLRPTIEGRPHDALELLELAGDRKRFAFIDERGGDKEADACLLVDLSDELRPLLMACALYSDAIPPEAQASLLERLPKLEQVAPVALPPELQGDEVAADGRLVLRLRAEAMGVSLEGFVRPIAGGPRFFPGEGPDEVTGLRDGKRVFARRARADELAHATRVVARLPLDEPLRPWHWTLASDEAALDLLQALKALGEDLEFEWADDTPALHVTREASASHLRVQVRDARDWFGLEGEINIDGEEVKLALLLDAMRRGQRYVKARDGHYVALEKTLRERLARLSDLSFTTRHGVEIGPQAAAALSDLSRDAAVDASAGWRATVERMLNAEALAPPPPRTLAAELRPYQLEGYQWLSRLAAWGVGACLADDMGLGKTVQALAVLIDRAPRGPALVVAPTSVCFNWRRECERFAPTLRPVEYREASLTGLGPYDVMIISYGMLTRDREKLAACRFATLVLDEAQAIKNAATARAQAVRAVDAEWRVALSGTPVENHLGELWSLFRAISPGLLGSWEQFRERFAAPIEREKNPARQKALAQLMRPFILRRTKAEVAPELPERIEVRVPIELSPEERALYDQARLAAAASLAKEQVNAREDKRFLALAALTRLRLAACHPRLYDRESAIASSKLAAFMGMVEDLRGNRHRALVFSQFTSHLALVREALDAAAAPYLYLDGATPAAERARLVDAFQRGEGDLFLISLTAGGTGLNLTAADYVFHLDPWWNPAVEDQATSRAHRIGQTRPVTVYRLVAEKTIEDAILALHADKRDLVAGVLGDSDVAAKLSTEALITLIRGGEPAAS